MPVPGPRWPRLLAILGPALALALACSVPNWRFAFQTPAEKPIFLWCDATANLERLGSTEKLAAVLDHCVAAGVTGVVIDVKPISGAVLYDSEFAPRLTRWPGHPDPSSGEPPPMQELDTDFDLLGEACRLGHDRGLTVFASMNVFAEGNKQVKGLTDAERGAVFSTHPDWAAWDYMALEGESEAHLRPTTEHATSYTAFVSPFNPEVNAYELSVIREVAEEYPIDGIVLDRVRFDGRNGDFSPWARQAFEQYVGHRVEHWPEDIMTRGGYDPDAAGEDRHGHITAGPLWDQWTLFRAQTIHDFMVEAREHVKDANPDCEFCDYVGAWYPDYWKYGVNWASPQFFPQWPGFPEGWERTGYADLMDMLFVGDYFYAVTPDEAVQAHRPDGRTDDWLSVGGSAQLAMRVVMGACPVIGSLYVEQYLFDSPTHAFNGEQFGRAMHAAFDNTDGLMIFDLVHLAQQDCWNEVETFGRGVHPRPTPGISPASNR
jgi:uncharacterized lipoprotein YddW (UPF0748 family)